MYFHSSLKGKVVVARLRFASDLMGDPSTIEAEFVAPDRDTIREMACIFINQRNQHNRVFKPITVRDLDDYLARQHVWLVFMDGTSGEGLERGE